MSKRMSKTMQRKMARLYTEYLLSKGEEGGNCPDWIDHLRALAEKDAVLAGIIFDQALPSVAQKVWHNDPKPVELEKQERSKEKGSPQLPFWPETIHGIKLSHTYTVPVPPTIEQASDIATLEERDVDCQRISAWHSTVQTVQDASHYKTTKAEQTVAAARRDADEAARIANIAGNDPRALLRDLCDQAQSDAA